MHRVTRAAYNGYMTWEDDENKEQRGGAACVFCFCSHEQVCLIHIEAAHHGSRILLQPGDQFE